jgi:hypothetical protein
MSAFSHCTVAEAKAAPHPSQQAKIPIHKENLRLAILESSVNTGPSSTTTAESQVALIYQFPKKILLLITTPYISNPWKGIYEIRHPHPQGCELSK